MTYGKASGSAPRADSTALAELSYRYASAVDRRDRDMLLGVFHPDAVLRVIRRETDGGERVSSRIGHEEIGEITEYLSRYDRTFHLVSNHRYEARADEVVGETYCVAHHLTVDGHGGTDIVMFIRYHDLYRPNADGVWLIANRDVQVDWTEKHVGVTPWAANPSSTT